MLLLDFPMVCQMFQAHCQIVFTFHETCRSYSTFHLNLIYIAVKSKMDFDEVFLLIDDLELFQNNTGVNIEDAIFDDEYPEDSFDYTLSTFFD